MEEKQIPVPEEGRADSSPKEVDMAAFYSNAASAAVTGYTFDPHAGNASVNDPPKGADPAAHDAEAPDPAGEGGDAPVSPGEVPSVPVHAGDSADAAEGGDADPRENNVPDFAAFHHVQALAEERPDAELPAPALGSGGAGESGENEGTEGAEDDVPMSLMGHLNELRRRLFRIVIVIVLGFVAFYGVSEPLYAYLSEPLRACLPQGSTLVYTSPQGAFFTYMKVALVASIFGTSPFSFYQVWAFVAPGLYREEKRAILPLAFFSSIFFLAGASFCFLVVFPLAFQFFMGFASDTIVPMISVEEYLSFALKLLIAFGLVFEMPLFTYFLARFGVLTPEFMRRSRKYAILLTFVVAAVLTPPDVISQILMALPMLLLYEVSIYVAVVARPGKKKKNTEESSEQKEAS